MYNLCTTIMKSLQVKSITDRILHIGYTSKTAILKTQEIPEETLSLKILILFQVLGPQTQQLLYIPHVLLYIYS